MRAAASARSEPNDSRCAPTAQPVTYVCEKSREDPPRLLVSDLETLKRLHISTASDGASDPADGQLMRARNRFPESATGTAVACGGGSVPHPVNVGGADGDEATRGVAMTAHSGAQSSTMRANERGVTAVEATVNPPTAAPPSAGRLKFESVPAGGEEAEGYSEESVGAAHYVLGLVLINLLRTLHAQNLWSIDDPGAAA